MAGATIKARHKFNNRNEMKLQSPSWQMIVAAIVCITGTFIGMFLPREVVLGYAIGLMVSGIAIVIACVNKKTK